MNKEKIIKIIKDSTGSTKDQATEAFNNITTAMVETLVDGDTVTLQNVGSLSTFTRKARNYRLPNGDVVTKDAHVDVRFKDFTELKSAINK